LVAVTAIAVLSPPASAQDVTGGRAYDCAATALATRNALRRTPDYGTGATSTGAEEINRTMVAFLFAGAEDAGCTGDLDSALAEVNARGPEAQSRFANRAVNDGLAEAFASFRDDLTTCADTIGVERMNGLRARVLNGTLPCGW
jgi:hypothetical protein